MRMRFFCGMAWPQVAAIFAAMLLMLGAPPEARAEEPASEPAGVWATIGSSIDAVDQSFADYVVTPLSDVMFFDLWFWDRKAHEQGDVVDGERLVEFRGNLEVWRTVIREATPEVVLNEPRDMQIGEIDVRIEPRSEGLVAMVPEQPIDLELAGVEPYKGEPATPEEAYEAVDTLAPFRIRINRATGRTVPSQLRVTGRMIPPSVGDQIRTEHGLATVIEIDAEGLALAEGLTERTQERPVTVPAVVAWLVLGALFFTFRMSFVNLRMFGHAIAVTMGRYDHEGAEGEISHFQALSSALSATVGLGNIAGVAIAVGVGGPGAVIWMILAGFLGMSSKFVECTLGQMYRIRRDDGSVSGGPMHYLDVGLAERGMATFGKVLAVVFALMCIGGSLGGGNMFQANQSNAAIISVLRDAGMVAEGGEIYVSVVYGLALAGLVGLVILGGIKRIGSAAELIVPFMCGLYVLAGLVVIVANASQIPAAFAAMFESAFSFQAGFGGFMWVLYQGFRRAAFSNEAGVGSASIAHSAATTEYPVREGVVALLEPFIDTIVVCTMTGLVVVVTGAYELDGVSGVEMTQAAFGSVVSWFPLLISVAVVLFAFSTMISWSYYGERCSVWLFGESAKVPYRVFFLIAVFFGANLKLGGVLDFSDLMVLGMAFPNILGALFLTTKVKEALDDYVAKLQSGAFSSHAGAQ